MNTDNAKWLEEANKKYESCAYSSKKGSVGACVLDGYPALPVLDCPTCKAYTEKEPKSEG